MPLISMSGLILSSVKIVIDRWENNPYLSVLPAREPSLLISVFLDLRESEKSLDRYLSFLYKLKFPGSCSLTIK